MKALVTGASGFVGSHMVDALLNRGYVVTGMDLNDVTYEREMELNEHLGSYYHAIEDVRDYFRYQSSSRRMTTETFDLVIHCAAVIGGRSNIDGSPLNVAQNLGIDADLFNWAIKTKQGPIVYYSSSAAYPEWFQYPNHYANTQSPRLSEDMIGLSGDNKVWMPDATYGWAKLSGEVLAGYARDAGQTVHILRPFSGYGPRQGTDYPFNAIIARAVNHDNPVKLWCDDCVRDWVHIDDIVRATLGVIDKGVTYPVNICSGVATSMAELAQLAITEVGYAAITQGGPTKPQGVKYRVGDPSLLKVLGLMPQITVQQGVKQAVDYMLKEITNKSMHGLM